MSQELYAHLKLRVQPGAARPGLAGWRGDSLRVRVSDPPTRGRANAAVASVLAQHLGVHRRDITIVRGHLSRDKVVQVLGMDAVELLRRLSSNTDGTGTESAR